MADDDDVDQLMDGEEDDADFADPDDENDEGHAGAAGGAGADAKTAAAHPLFKAHPSPALTPEQVVRRQLDAMRQNRIGGDNTGIAIAFRYASPENKAYTGPVARFIQMLRSPMYDCMVNFEDYKISPAGSTGSQWLVTLVKNGTQHSFVWGLNKQTSGQYKGCWMTDSVMKVR